MNALNTHPTRGMRPSKAARLVNSRWLNVAGITAELNIYISRLKMSNILNTTNQVYHTYAYVEAKHSEIYLFRFQRLTNSV
jgi:hypothetical protein